MASRQKGAPPRTSIISAVEVSYFRSFYKIYLDDLDDLNILFGENDTGKSNLMRALNLFFNNAVDDEYEFDFDVDFSARRAAEAQGAADVRKFAYVKIWFRSPAVHKQALGNEFYVKRTWSQSTVPEYRQETSRNIDTPGKQQSLTKFLNKISFTYIPAVKDREVYSSLLTSSYNAIAKAETFSAALRTFTDEIRNQTTDLSQRLGKSLGMESELAPPTDLGELFASLDFQTLVAGGDQMSLIRQRGDGVQARHIPEIMAFIAEKDARPYHIWGIEEPENSLSINSAMLLSGRLKEIARESKIQVFLTTHSPAFYCLSGAGVKKTFLKAGEDDVETLDGTSSSTRDLMEFMGDRFYLPLVAESMLDAKAKADELEAAVAELTAKIVHHNRPMLFVEGETEERLLNHLLQHMGDGVADRLEIVPLGSASHAERLSAMTESLVKRLLSERRGFILLDSDQAGRNALPRQVDRQLAKRQWVQSANRIRWRLLPPTAEATEAFQAAGVTNPELFGVCLEDCFSAALRSQAMHAGAYGLTTPREVAHRADLFSISPSLNHEEHRFYLLAPDGNRKRQFVDWLIETGNFASDTLVAIIGEILEEV